MDEHASFLQGELDGAVKTSESFWTLGTMRIGRIRFRV